ncbi:unnamed protein product [Caenorhabditis auriculariae]|uniref:Potassium channel domain-containing protein n=1 Tax=Caenorhabditis auriculariae TaxID=2777116 RepID=A0A8S1HEC9_9PELO|nr:unnamed protein product [Caenorhabditis auriculariae]
MTTSDVGNAVVEKDEESEKDSTGIVERFHLRAVLLHLGLVLTCIGYVLVGASLFRSIERPIELTLRKRALADFEQVKSDFLGNISHRPDKAEEIVSDYAENLMKLFENPHYSHVFESHHTDYQTEKDLWTYSSSVIFTTTTVIPVGYGYIYPLSDLGKVLLIAYALLGIPLTLVTMADTGKFASQLITQWFDEVSCAAVFYKMTSEQSTTIPTALFLTLLFSYPMVVGLVLSQTSSISFLDAVYFSLTSIFTIGFGDLTPEMNVVQLVLFLVAGVILVTITVDFVAAEIIDHVHYMGRHVGKARQLAGKMFQLAQSINMNRGISGLASGMNQLHALARLGILGKAERESMEPGRRLTAFEPALDGIDFVDTTSIYSRFEQNSRSSRKNSARHLFVS